MIVGHYGVSFAVKRLEPSIPLWVLFVATQFVDVVWAIFVLLGIEKLRIVPGITASNDFDLYYMPYTHSLTAALIWSVAASVLFRASYSRASLRAPLLVGATVLSHWLLDLIVHRPDLPVFGDNLKVGLGLWNLPITAFVVESAILLVGLIILMPRLSSGRTALVCLSTTMLVSQGVVFIAGTSFTEQQTALSALTTYAVFAALVYWVELKQRRKDLQGA